MSASPLPLNAATMALQTASLLNNAQPTTPVQLPVVTLPDAAQLLNLTRPITLNGEAIALFAANELSIHTIMGQITLSLKALDQDLFNQLQSLFNTALGEKVKLDVVLMPGKPPESALVFIPKADSKLRLSDAQTTPLPQATKEAPLGKGDFVKLGTLPKDLDIALIKQDQPHPATSTIESKTEPHMPGFLQRLVGHPSPAKPLFAEVTSSLSTIDPEMGAVPFPTPDDPILPKDKAISALPERALSSSSMSGNTYLIKTLYLPTQDVPHELPVGTLLADVTGKTHSGHLIVKADGQSFVLHARGEVPLGSKLLLAPLDDRYALPALPLLDESDARLIQSLHDLTASLHTIDPLAAQNFTGAKIPTPTQHMPATILFLFSALYSGNVEEWLGPSTMARLELTQKRKIGEAFTQALQNAPKTLNDTHNNLWQSWSIPIMNGAACDILKLYVRRDREHHSTQIQDTEKTFTRFVISVSMSQLGVLQLDGLSQPKKLDLVVRSENELPAGLCNDLRETTTRTFEAIGLTGSLLFQSGRKNWLQFQNNQPIGIDI